MNGTEKRRNGIGEWPWLTIAVAMAAAAAWAMPGAAEWLEWRRAGEGLGAIGRLWSANLAHWTGSHFAWDLAAWVALGWVCERQGRALMALCIALAAPAIVLAVAATEPGLWSYRGLSGLDSALFILAAGRLGAEAIADRRRWTAASAGLLVAGFIGKTLYETLTGAALFAESGGVFVVTPAAHLAGAAVAAALVAGSVVFGRSSSAPGPGDEPTPPAHGKPWKLSSHAPDHPHAAEQDQHAAYSLQDNGAV